MMPYFWHLAINQNSKFNNFLWACWFLYKNLSNFVPPLKNSTTRTAITLNSLFLDAPEAPAGSWCVASNFTRIQMKIFLLNW